jgi:hypothetical protein
MNSSSVIAKGSRGSTLIEAVIAAGVLAVAIPLVFGALAESAKSGMSAAAETRSPWIISACMAEIHASRDGHPQFFTPTAIHQTFPPDDDVWALAFSAEGLPIGNVQLNDYQKGTGSLNGHPVRYIANLTSTEADTHQGATPMLSTHIVIEYPAISPVSKRQKIDFYTRIP